MGMFPYYCVYCGGGYSRCGSNCSSNTPSSNTPSANTPSGCQGGQFCWEEDCIFSIVEPYDVKKFGKERWEKIENDYKDKHLSGKYDGYGRVMSDISGITFIPCEFGEFVKFWGNVENVVLVDICCKSCYELN